MSESSSFYTDSSDLGGHSDIVGTNVPLILTSAYREEQLNTDRKTLPKLPSHRYKYTTWHELNHTHVKGDQLKAPRVREGPSIKEKTFYSTTTEQGMLIHHDKKGRERKDYRNTTENWENAEFANLSFQDLYDRYQRENFTRILKRLVRVVDLNIFDNGLADLHTVTFPCCTHLNLSRNHLSSLKSLPRAPRLKHLTVGDNNILSLDGIEQLKKIPLDYLYMKGNPIEFQEHYRKRVFESLPQLKILDNIPKLPSDNWGDDDTRPKSGLCLIS